jgi:hypothetical protein
LVYAQDEKQQEEKPAHQEEAKPQPKQEAKPTRPEEGKPAQDKQMEKQDQKRGQEQSRQEAKPQGQEHPEMQGDHAKPAQEHPEMQNDRNRQGQEHPEMQNNNRQEHSQMQGNDHGRAAGKGGHIPDERFHSQFGREHHFNARSVIVQGRPQFQYGGYNFELVDAWPSGWAYTDDCYIDYIDGEYYLIDLNHPEVRLAVFVVM